MTMTIEGYDGERVLISYDVAGSERSAAARVCQIVFGRSKRAAVGRTESGGFHLEARGRLDRPVSPRHATGGCGRTHRTIAKTRSPGREGSRFDGTIIARGVSKERPGRCLTC